MATSRCSVAGAEAATPVRHAGVSLLAGKLFLDANNTMQAQPLAFKPLPAQLSAGLLLSAERQAAAGNADAGCLPAGCAQRSRCCGCRLRRGRTVSSDTWQCSTGSQESATASTEVAEAQAQAQCVCAQRYQQLHISAVMHTLSRNSAADSTRRSKHGRSSLVRVQPILQGIARQHATLAVRALLALHEATRSDKAPHSTDQRQNDSSSTTHSK